MTQDKRRRRQELVPSAKRLISSLRDIGYDLPSAVADLIDNSIAAGATVVHVDTEFSGAKSWIRIADNGGGMTERKLTEAMRFGTRREYNPRDLGKFGLGLKSASLSQCRCLTVATRAAKDGPIRVAQWDLDHVQRTDRWEVRRPGIRGVRPEVVAPIARRRGTVVFWESLDRVLRYRIHGGQRAEDGFAVAVRELEEHIEMLFHRFLDGSATRRRPLSIFVNDRKLIPWDPFAKSEVGTYRLPSQTFDLANGRRKGSITVQPFVLPTEAAFSSPAAHRRAAGPKKWNRQQGFYFYRNDRMIQSGGWNRLRTPDEHVKLARVSVDFPTAADSQFELNVSKTQVRIPMALRSEFSALASSVALVAQNAYRRPAQGYDFALGSSEDPRIRAAHDLVEMVVAVVQRLIEEEAGRDNPLRERLIRRLREMQSGLIRDMYVAVSSNGHADSIGQSRIEAVRQRASNAG